MSLPRVVVDNSAILPAFFPEPRTDSFDAGLVTARSRGLVQAIRLRRVNAYVPPSFFREFLAVGVARGAGERTAAAMAGVREQWDDLLSLPLIPVPLDAVLHHVASLTFDDLCPPADAWYVAAAAHANAEFWVSHAHADDLVAVARRHVTVRLLSDEPPSF